MPVVSWHYLGGVALVAAAAFGASVAGDALLLPGTVAAFWPATGVAFAILYLGGLHWWPGIAVGQALAWFLWSLPLGLSIAETAANMAAAFVSVLIVLRLVGPGAGMDRLSHVGAVLVAFATGEAIGATIATLSARLYDVVETPELAEFWRAWWLGDVSGGLVVAPLALAWMQSKPERWARRRIGEAVLMLAVVAVLSVVALSVEQPLTYLVFPGLIWAALRLGAQGATLAIAIAAVIAVWMTANDFGTFVESAQNATALALQLYLVSATLTTLCLAAIVSERRRAAGELADSRARIVAAGAQERRRLEAELHDSAQNRLIALLVRLGLARDAAEERAPDLVPALDALIEDTQAAGDELRRIAHGILPPILASDGIAAALRAESAHSAIGVRVTDGGVGRSGEDIELAVYLTCLEAIQNAAKHAGSRAAVTVTLERASDELVFVVRDTGSGFDPSAALQGLGLANVRSRIETLGGRVDVVSAPGRGTTVSGVVPWPARSGPAA